MSDEVSCLVVHSDHQRLEQMSVRWDVFVAEQSVAPVLEIDARDFLDSTTHLIAVDHSSGQVIGAARLLRDADEQDGAHFHVGRVAVRRQWRGRGVGEQLMRFAESVACDQVPEGENLTLILDAQVQATGFYGRLGYDPTDTPQFYDADILHQEMSKTVTGTGPQSVGEAR